MFDMQTPEWFKSHHSPEYTAYLEAVLPPTTVDAATLAAAGEALRATSFAAELVTSQRADGGWEQDGADLWYQSLPRRLEILVDYGFNLLDDPLARGVRRLLALQRPDGSFALDVPGGIPYDEAYNAACIRALVGAGLRAAPVVRQAAERLLAARRHDGGWSTLPIWLRRPGAPIPDPEPSCPICSDLATFALGTALDLPAPLRDELLATRLTVEATSAPGARAARWRERLAFMANQGMRAGDARVDEALAGLAACRGGDGRFAHHESPGDYVPPALAEVVTRHLEWRVGARGD